ncbi:MAG TPA: heme-binding protein [Burkholderiales bacterium]|nr:heme-binding protein [Burkholderiales bacterium]
MPAFKRVIPVLFVLSSASVMVQAGEAPRPEYGPDITVETAKKIAAATIAECSSNKWNVAVAITNTHGSLVYYERMNNTQSASARIAVDKASAASMYRRPTRAFVDAIAKTGPATMTLPGVVASPGGVPIFSAGKIIGAVGVSGVTGDQDEQCAKAGLAGLN